MSFAFPVRRHDYLLHLATATSAHLDRTDPVEMLPTKLASIRRVLDYARQAGVRRMLVTSSGAVYGPQPAELSHIPETYNGAPDPMNPASAYGHGKRLVEQMCALTPEVPCVIARCFSFIGPHLPLDGRFAAGNFLQDAISGGSITVRGDGRAVRSYLYAADLVVWLLTIIVHGQGGRAYNVGSEHGVSISDLAFRVSSVVDGNSAVDLQAQCAGQLAQRYVPLTHRARHELGLEIRIDLDDTLQRTINWLREAAETRAKRLAHACR